MSGTKQYHLRTTDEAFVRDVEHEMKRAGGRSSEAATVLALAQDGLLYRRWMREQEALAVYQGLSTGEAEVEQDHGAGGAETEQDRAQV